MKTLISNRKAYYNFDISEKLTAGVALNGAEVKSIKNSQASLDGSYISIQDSQAYLVNAHVSPYKYALASQKSNPERKRKLLLQKKEIKALIGKDKGVAIIPLELILNDKGVIKLRIGIGKSKKKFDKREAIKKREAARRIRKQED